MNRHILAACGGFLLAVLWFDLMFDVQVFAIPESQLLPEPILASIATYYRRVTVDAFPMNRLVGGVMIVAVVASAIQLARRRVSRLRASLTLILCAAPTALALARVVPNAMRLATRVDTPAVQSELARTIFRDHLLCVLAIVVFLALQIGPAPRSRER